jgi:hypothetical protein
MPTHAQVAADLLRAAATFFRNIADTNQELKGQMETNAETYEVIAKLVESDPQGELDLEEEQPANDQG